MIFLQLGMSATIRLGPFLDETDGKTAEEGLTIQKAHVRLSKNGGAFGPANASQGVEDAGAPHDESGFYAVALDATDTNTTGRLRVAVHVAGALPVWQDVTVLPFDNYDALIVGLPNLPAMIGELPTATPLDAQATANALKLAPAAGAPAETSVYAALAAIPTTNPSEPPSAATIADAVWDEATAGHVATGTFGKLFADVWTSIGAALATAVAAVKGVVDAIKVRTDTIGAATLTVTSPITAGGDLTLVAGDDYSGSRAIPFVLTGWTGDDLTGAAASVRVIRAGNWAGEDTAAERTWPVTLTQNGTTVTGTCELTPEQTAGLRTAPPAGEWNYRWQLRLDAGVTVGGALDPLDSGRMRVVKRIV